MKGIVLSILLLLAVAFILFTNKPTAKNPSLSPTESRVIEADIQQDVLGGESMDSSLSTTETEAAQVNAEAQLIIGELKTKAKQNWPDDYTTQEYWINQQLEDYNYMLGIEENSIKRKAQHSWPLDYSTQKYWYNEQIAAKERLK
jgi:hypothetical protein